MEIIQQNQAHAATMPQLDYHVLSQFGISLQIY